jgi:hypothetical protein
MVRVSYPGMVPVECKKVHKTVCQSSNHTDDRLAGDSFLFCFWETVVWLVVAGLV